MVELVDTRDLKSRGLAIVRAGSSPALGTICSHGHGFACHPGMWILLIFFQIACSADFKNLHDKPEVLPHELRLPAKGVFESAKNRDGLIFSFDVVDDVDVELVLRAGFVRNERTVQVRVNQVLNAYLPPSPHGWDEPMIFLIPRESLRAGRNDISLSGGEGFKVSDVSIQSAPLDARFEFDPYVIAEAMIRLKGQDHVFPDARSRFEAYNKRWQSLPTEKEFYDAVQSRLSLD